MKRKTLDRNKESDEAFIARMAERARIKRQVRTDPVEVGLSDLDRLIALARSSVFVQPSMFTSKESE